MMSADREMQMRLKAFEDVRKLSETLGHLTPKDLGRGFMFEGERIPLVQPRWGIFKPQRMRYLLSIKTVFPKPGGQIWYDDQRDIHRQVLEGNETMEYAFMGNNPNSANNLWLREAYENRIPVIYFLGVAPHRFQAIIPAFITEWDADTLKARVSFGLQEQDKFVLPKNDQKRRYAMRKVKQRLHQGVFREAVITAYGGRCALSGLPEQRLLDAAHIIPDQKEHGQAVVQNGLLLSKTHHAAFDADLIGIAPDYRLHVSEQLLGQNDGPMLEALKQLNGEPLRLPRRPEDYPDRDRLAERFEQFEAAI